MFHFLRKKKENNIVVTDKIWISEAAKLQACLKQIKEENTIVVTWFDATYRKLESLLLNENLTTDKIFIFRELAAHYIQDSLLIFAEHYPLWIKEQEIYKKLGLSKAMVYSSLDEPLFSRFGGDKISSFVKQIGLKEDEAIEHPLITASIRNAQEKISRSVSLEQAANSQSDWLLYNMAE